MAKKNQDAAGPDPARGEPGLQETLELLGCRARIVRRSKMKGVVATFPNGYVARAGFRYYAAGFEGRRGADAEAWKDAETDLLDGSAAWYGPDGNPSENPVGGGFSSLGEFAVRAAALGVFS